MNDSNIPDLERQSIDVDIACVGFGPAMGGFLTTLSQNLFKDDGTPEVESKVMPGMPVQVACYERADDIGFGVSGVATRAKGIKEIIHESDISQISMAVKITEEKVVYLQDPIGASRRSWTLRTADAGLKLFRWLPFYNHHGFELPYIPPFLRKDGGYIFSIGQFNQWIGSQIMASGTATIWPGTPVKGPLIKNKSVVGVRLMDQGTEKDGRPGPGFMPGMDVRAALTVVGDGPVGAVGRQLDEHFGMPEGHHQTEWAVGTKMVIDLPDKIDLKPGTIIHTLGYPEPEIFGFFYVHSENLVSAGIFVPSWFHNPVRTSYRYLQHWMLHPYIWRYVKDGKLRSWGAKSLQESGKRGEPFLAGNGYARIGEGSGSTNVLTGSGVDEAWVTGVLLAESVIELIKSDRPFTRENLQNTYVRRRRQSWVESEGKVAERARDGFTRGFITGLLGMALTGLTGGKLNVSGKIRQPHEVLPSIEEFYSRHFSPVELDKIKKESHSRGMPLHDILMDKSGWPSIPFDGKLLVSQQDALLLGGKVQAPPGYADHVVFLYPDVCEACANRICVEICSGQAIENDPEGGVRFDREKCVHCGACMWNCSQTVEDGKKTNLEFTAGTGGLHSAEN
jgi:electron-transferring-flavoprotein dehydrogenase